MLVSRNSSPHELKMPKRKPLDFKKSIRASGLDIYSPIEVGDANLWMPAPHIETLLNEALKGLNLADDRRNGQT